MDRKGQSISINTLIIIALAVFTVVLVIGFVTGGFGYFTGKFKDVTSTGDNTESAKLKCNQWCAQYKSEGSPEVTSSSAWYPKLVDVRQDLDLNDDGVIDTNDEYTCSAADAAKVSAAANGNVISCAINT